MLLAIGTRENGGESLKKKLHVGSLVRVHHFRAGCSEAFHEKMEIVPEYRSPFRGFLDKEGRRLIGRRGLTFFPTITRHLPIRGENV
jgi:hypothetical protein